VLQSTKSGSSIADLIGKLWILKGFGAIFFEKNFGKAIRQWYIDCSLGLGGI
jgi:hypothetical protein